MRNVCIVFSVILVTMFVGVESADAFSLYLRAGYDMGYFMQHSDNDMNDITMAASDEEFGGNSGVTMGVDVDFGRMPFSISTGVLSSKIKLLREKIGDVTNKVDLEHTYYPVDLTVFPIANNHWRVGIGPSWVGNVRRKEMCTINKLPHDLEANERRNYEKVYSYGLGGHIVAEYKRPLVGDSQRLLFWPRVGFHYATMLNTEEEDIPMDNYDQDYWKINFSIGFGYKIW